MVVAADLTAKYGAELLLLTIGREIARSDLGMEHIREPVSTIAIESMREGLAGVCGRARLSTEIFVGDPAKQIFACADAKQADPIALGTRGQRRLAGLLLGSVAQLSPFTWM